MTHEQCGDSRQSAFRFSPRAALAALCTVEREMGEAIAVGGSGVVHSAMRAMTSRDHRGRGPGPSSSAGRSGRVRAYRQLRGRVRRLATPYLYSTYEVPPLFGEPVDQAQVSDDRKVMILGGGPNRIGQGTEFDYCCCQCGVWSGAATRGGDAGAGYEVIMVS